MTDYSVVVTQSCEAAFRLQVPFFNKPFFKFTAKVPKENCLVQAEIFLAVLVCQEFLCLFSHQSGACLFGSFKIRTITDNKLHLQY